MSEQVEAKTDDTAAAENQGQDEGTAVSTAESAEETAKETSEQSETSEETGGETALYSEEEKPAEDESESDSDDETGDESNKEEDSEENEGSVVEQALSDVELPEGFDVSEEDKGFIGEWAGKHKASKDAVKDLIDLQTKREQARIQKAQTAQKEFIGKMRDEAQKLPQETRAAAKRFIEKYGSEGLQSKMKDPAFYIGNDVDIINVLAIAQKAVDGGFVDGSSAGGGKEKSAAETLYDN